METRDEDTTLLSDAEWRLYFVFLTDEPAVTRQR